jgi:DNA end-binding protein Ku
MPRPLWNGSLSFGLVNVPVQLTGATRDLDLHFRQLHKKDGAPIEQRRYCSQDDAEIQWEEVGRGYELDDGKQVVLTDEELASVQPEKTRTIDVQSFVDLEDVDPIYFDNTWFLVPAGDSQGTRRAYRLLVEVMETTERAALGRFVIRPTDGIAPGGRKPAKEKIEQAVAVIESLGTDWDPERYTDCYRQRLEKVVEQKKKGQKVKAPSEPKEPTPAPDLMEALQATLEKMGSSKDKGNGKGSRKKAAAKT